jgi:hypothetical protein
MLQLMMSVKDKTVVLSTVKYHFNINTYLIILKMTCFGYTDHAIFGQHVFIFNIYCVLFFL